MQIVNYCKGVKYLTLALKCQKNYSQNGDISFLGIYYKSKYYFLLNIHLPKFEKKNGGKVVRHYI